MDNGFNPLVDGNMTATFTDNNITKTYVDHCLDANTLVEYACGDEFDGAFITDNNAYALTFDCTDLNKVCSIGKCV
jgi:hypothetical protein